MKVKKYLVSEPRSPPSVSYNEFKLDLTGKYEASGSCRLIQTESAGEARGGGSDLYQGGARGGRGGDGHAAAGLQTGAGPPCRDGGEAGPHQGSVV